MVRVIFMVLSIFILVKADVYEENCLACHKTLPVSIDKYFYRYLLKYSSEKRVKESMIQYLQEPSAKHTIMPEAFIRRFGIKKATTLTPEQLQKAIDTYWDTYKVFGKLQ